MTNENCEASGSCLIGQIHETTLIILIYILTYDYAIKINT